MRLPKPEQRHWALAAIAALFFFRLWRLRSAPFILDEPLFELLLDDHFAAGTFPLHALMGSRGVPYGPFVLWWHGLWRLLSDSLLALYLANAASFALAFLAFFAAAKRACGDKAALLALALAVSSPFFFFYSRLIGDVSLIPMATSLILCSLSLLEQRSTKAGWILFGLGCGFAFDIHLMTLPVIAAGELAALALACRRRNGWGFAMAGLISLAAAAPYLWGVKTYLTGGFGISPGGQFPHFPLLEAGRIFQFFTPHGMDYFFDGNLSAYLPAGFGQRLILVPGFGHLVATLLCLAAGFFSWRTIRGREPSLVLQFSLLSFFGLLAYYSFVPVPWIHPHYFLPLWWLGGILAAFALARAPKNWRMALQGLIALVAITNTIFVVCAFSAVYKRGGTLGIHYGPALDEIANATKNLCRSLRERGTTEASVNISQALGTFPPSFQYFSRHLEACQGLRLSWKGGDRFAIRQANPQSGAHLSVE